MWSLRVSIWFKQSKSALNIGSSDHKKNKKHNKNVLKQQKTGAKTFFTSLASQNCCKHFTAAGYQRIRRTRMKPRHNMKFNASKSQPIRIGRLYWMYIWHVTTNGCFLDELKYWGLVCQLINVSWQSPGISDNNSIILPSLMHLCCQLQWSLR